MANTLRFKRGLASGIPTALAGEPLFTTDTFDLYIGNGTTNTRFQKYIASGATTQILRGDGSLYTFPLAISSPSNGQVLKYNGTSWVNDSDAGITGSGAAGQVAYFTGATTQAGSNNLFWDATNGRLGIGTAGAAYKLDVSNAGTNTIRVINTASTADAYLLAQNTLGSALFGINATGQYMYNATSIPILFYTNGTERARIFATGNFGINTGATDSGQRLQVIGTGYFSDSVGIGAVPLSFATLYLAKTITGSGYGYGILQEGVIQSNVTSFSMGFYNLLQTQATSFTLNNYYHYFAQQATLGAGSSVTNQYGFFVDSSLVGATNNYGFYGNIAAATGRWNLYMNGTALNYINSSLLIGSTTSSGEALQVTGTMKVTGATQIDGNLTVDTNTLFVNSSTNRVGILTTSPISPLQVNGQSRQVYSRAFVANPLDADGYAGHIIVNTNGSNGDLAGIGMFADSTYTAGAGIFATRTGSSAAALVFYSGSNFSPERMRLDASGNLGLGVTPSAWSGKSMQIVNSSLTDVVSSLQLTYNAYFDGASTWRYITSAAASNYYQAGGFHVWRTVASGTAGNAITWTDAMTLTSGGNLGIGTTNADPFSRGYTRMLGLSTSTASGSTVIELNGGSGGYAQIDFGAGGTRTAGISGSANETQWGSLTAIPAIIYTNSSEKMRITSGGNLLIGSTTDSGEKLQVTGTAKITGATTFGSSIIASGLISSATEFRLNNQAFSKVAILDAGGGFAGGYNFNLSGSTPQHSLTGAISGVYYGSGGTINFYTGTSQAAGTTATSRMLLDASGNLYVDTNTLFVDATNNRVGVLTTTPSEPLHVAGNMLISGANSFKMRNLAGTDVNVIRAVSGGTSVLSTATLGNNIAIGTQSAHDFLLCSSDTERIRLSSSGWFSHTTATNPSSSVTDSYVQYSADITAGNAAPHFRTENGAVIKLYQETTAVGNSIISLGGGNSVLDDTTFDGYTLRQIVKALRNQGILA